MFMTMPGLRMDINVTLPWAVTLIILHANNNKMMTYMTKLGQNRLPQMKTKALQHNQTFHNFIEKLR